MSWLSADTLRATLLELRQTAHEEGSRANGSYWYGVQRVTEILLQRYDSVWNGLPTAVKRELDADREAHERAVRNQAVRSRAADRRAKVSHLRELQREGDGWASWGETAECGLYLSSGRYGLTKGEEARSQANRFARKGNARDVTCRQCLRHAKDKSWPGAAERLQKLDRAAIQEAKSP